jgi:hypothetical protein
MLYAALHNDPGGVEQIGSSVTQLWQNVQGVSRLRTLGTVLLSFRSIGVMQGDVLHAVHCTTAAGLHCRVYFQRLTLAAATSW